MTPLEVQMDSVKHDQYVVKDVLERFDFDLAAKLVAMYVEQKALSEKRPVETAWKPSAAEMYERAGKIVLDVLKLGREQGFGVSISAGYLTARYSPPYGETPDVGEILEHVELELSTVSSYGIRIRDKHLVGIRAYLDAMGGGWLDEDGRWKPGDPPNMKREEAR